MPEGFTGELEHPRAGAIVLASIHAEESVSTRSRSSPNSRSSRFRAVFLLVIRSSMEAEPGAGADGGHDGLYDEHLHRSGREAPGAACSLRASGRSCVRQS